MNETQNNFTILLRRIWFLFILYFLGRLLFLVFNYFFFASFDLNLILSSFYYGMRYDITAIIISNIIFISMHLLPFDFFYKKSYQRVLKILFLVINIPLLLFSCIDIGLFRFTGKRSGTEIFSIMSFGNDFINTVPNTIGDFWYLVLLFFGLVYFLNSSYKRVTIFKNKDQTLIKTPVSLLAKIIFFLLFLTLTFIGFRGGIQYKPLNILSASGYGAGKMASLVLNTPFTIIKTFGKKKIEEVQWMTNKKAEDISPVIKKPHSANSFVSKNIVVIILESFGKEYIGSLNSYTGYTPFLDSLIGKSLVFPNAYANGKRSIEGIPAIVAGIPALMAEPFISSYYSGNSVSTLPILLKAKGYSSQFLHGGTNGTMGFDNFSKSAGFDSYFGRTEFNNDNNFDGSWGIYDEPFLARSALELNKMKSPFIATIFTLSSHHPYKIPDAVVNKFPEGPLPIHQSIRYADYSLHKFFESISKMNWYQNTIFVITADHTALSEYPFYSSEVGLFSIPVIFFSPNDSALHGKNLRTTQQIDIIPSVLDYLHYDHPYFSLGNSVFDSTEAGYAITYIDENYQLISDNYSLILNLNEKKSLYNFSADSLLKTNLSGKDTTIENIMESKLKSVVQNFNQSMIYNKMK